MKSVADLTKEDFEALVGQSLDVAGIELHIEAVSDGKADAGFPRKPFSVILTAPEAVGAPAFAGPVPVKHEALGELELMVNRIASRADEAVFQIIFN